MDGPELVFGVVGPVGTDRNELIEVLGDKLQDYGYSTERVHVSVILRKLPGLTWLEGMKDDEFSRIKRHMRAGTLVREVCERGDTLACFSVAEIRKLRAEAWKKNDAPNHLIDNGANPEDVAKPRTAYILDSIKHPGEIETLRAVYGRAFSVISVYTDRDQRIKNLAKRIANSRLEPQRADEWEPAASELIHIDEKEAGTKLGQSVRTAFPKADFFLNASDHSQLRKDVDRFLELLFNNFFRTPTIDEFGMFFAEAASWRSADLGRQVGAAILSETGQVLGIGFNESPKPFGGYNWDGDNDDFRDFQTGEDPGTKQKQLMIAEVVQRLAQSDLVHDSKKDDAKHIASDIAAGKSHSIFHDIQALNVIEYSRSVHAEMSAICDAASRGVSIKGAQMFVNTFPCHICARHILASGIKRLVYIEPYPKSLTETLYEAQISTRTSGTHNKVPFEAFSGVAPRRYQFLFKLQGDRKSDAGDVNTWHKREAKPKLKRYVLSYIAIEQTVVGKLLETIEQKLTDNRNRFEQLETEFKQED